MNVDKWVHIKCAGISPANYKQLQENDEPWFCPVHIKVQTINEPNLKVTDDITKTCTETFRQINDSFTNLEDEDNEWKDIPNSDSETESNKLANSDHISILDNNTADGFNQMNSIHDTSDNLENSNSSISGS